MRAICTFLLVILLGLVFFSPTCPPAPGPRQAALREAPAATASAASPPECYPANPTACDGVCKELLERMQAERARSTWPEYYNDVTAEIYRRGVSEGVVVEVGTAYGGLARHILKTHPKVRVIAVDPFFGDYDSGDSMSDYFKGLREKYGQEKFSALWAQAMAYEAGQDFGCRYAIHNTYSEKAAALFPKRSIDMVFIDGDHTREGVEKDIRAWSPILKVGRMLLFNDYQQASWPGVVQAVDALAERTAQEVYWLPQRVWGNVGLFNLPELFSTPVD